MTSLIRASVSRKGKPSLQDVNNYNYVKNTENSSTINWLYEGFIKVVIITDNKTVRYLIIIIPSVKHFVQRLFIISYIGIQQLGIRELGIQ